MTANRWNQKWLEYDDIETKHTLSSALIFYIKEGFDCSSIFWIMHLGETCSFDQDEKLNELSDSLR